MKHKGLFSPDIGLTGLVELEADFGSVFEKCIFEYKFMGKTQVYIDQNNGEKFVGYPPCRHCRRELEVLARKISQQVKSGKIKGVEGGSDDPYEIFSCSNNEPPLNVCISKFFEMKDTWSSEVWLK